MSVPLDPRALEAVLVDASAEVVRRASSPLDVVHKSDLSPVTIVDRAIDALLKRELLALIPEAGWLSEETEDDRERLRHDLVWIVDPIDGTKQLVAGIPEVAISIGLASRGRVVAAALSNPMTGERGVWVAGSAPAFRGLTPRPVPDSLDEAEALLSRSESEDGGLENVRGVVGRTRVIGSVAYKLLRVASGADTLTYSIRSKSEWDICGGVGLLTAAGLVYLRLDGAALEFNRPDPTIPSGAVAGPRILAEPLRDRLLRRLGEGG